MMPKQKSILTCITIILIVITYEIKAAKNNQDENTNHGRNWNRNREPPETKFIGWKDKYIKKKNIDLESATTGINKISPSYFKQDSQKQSGSKIVNNYNRGTNSNVNRGSNSNVNKRPSSINNNKGTNLGKQNNKDRFAQNRGTGGSKFLNSLKPTNNNNNNNKIQASGTEVGKVHNKNNENKKSSQSKIQSTIESKSIEITTKSSLKVTSKKTPAANKKRRLPSKGRKNKPQNGRRRGRGKNNKKQNNKKKS